MLHGGEIRGLGTIEYDFSVNINPLGIPEQVCASLARSMPLLQRYPDQECFDLRQALSKETGVPAEKIVCGNGASELIEAAVRAIRPESVLVTAPSFYGYRHAAEGAGAAVREHFLRREEDFALTERFLDDLEKEPDMVILASPANPVGNLIEAALLKEILETCARKKIWLMIDECFLCFTEEAGVRTMRRFIGCRSETVAETRRLLVLDAFTKRFAMPGVRLGYLMAEDPAVLMEIRRQQPEWSVSVPAQIAGLAALENNAAYLEKTVRLVTGERKRMAGELRAFGFRVFPGDANFIFFSSQENGVSGSEGRKGTDLQKELLKQGILIRSCENYPGLERGDYRVSIRLPEENTVLLHALERIQRGETRCGSS